MTRSKKITNQLLGEIESLLSLKQKHIVSPEQAVKQWLQQLTKLPSVKGRVLITCLRNQTWIEWSLYCAAVIRQWGYETTLIYNSSEINKFYRGGIKGKFWSLAGQIPGIERFDFSDLETDKNYLEKNYSQNLKSCQDALAYDLHLEAADIEDNLSKYKDTLELYRKNSASNSAKVYALCKNNNYHVFICYSGLIGETNSLMKSALDAGKEVVCLEGWGWRKGHMIYNFNAPALEYNVKGWMKYFGKWDDKKAKEMNQYFNFLEGLKQEGDWLKEFYNVQQAKVESELPVHIKEFIKGEEKVFLLACNVIGDSSILNRERFFRSHQEFVKNTVEYFSKHPEIKLIIRAHPGEEWVKQKVAVMMGEYSKRVSQGVKNVLVIDYDEKINTFSLVPFVHAGLVWLSSAGVDFVVRGLPVISVANAKYSGLGIVEEPQSEQEYFSLIQKFTTQEIRPTPEQIQIAKEYLYMVFKGFSFEAYGKNFRANTCRLNHMPSQKEHDTFYKILLKLEPAPDKLH